MIVVFLSPHFPRNMWLYVRRLREAGATVLGIADCAYDALRHELRDALAGYYRVDDLHNLDQLRAAVRHFQDRHGRIDRLESLNEYWLETDARLRTEFDIPGLRLDDMDRVKRKSAMKTVFEAAGVAVGRALVLHPDGAPDARRFVDAVGYPFVAKPDVGVGAARTYVIGNDADLDAFLGDRPPIDYILEEYLEGQLLSYDGLVDREGEVVYRSSLVYGIPVLESVRGTDMYFWIDREIPDDLDAIGRRIVAAYGIRERPFHFEFFRMPDGRLVALEVNMRQPGGAVVDMWNWAGDIDFYRAWAEVVALGTTTVSSDKPWYVMWAGRKPGRPYRLTHEEIVERFAPLLIHVERVDDVFATAMGAWGYVLRNPSLETVRAAADAILDTSHP
ncbi:MAG TPA: ATP-grasp domain-containing protein [Candidatus Binatia bacterium]|nr:ATP-grasp domain-containing protein [Candidatus Binatia bacterium]